MIDRKLGLYWVPVLLAAILGCAHGRSQGASPELSGREFLLQSAEGVPLLAKVRVRLGFSPDSVNFRANCNHLFGNYKLEGSRLILDGVGATEMGCAAEEHARDEWLASFFMSKPVLDHSGTTLTIANDTTRLVFLDRIVADPDRPLQSTVWEVEMYVDGESAMGLMEIKRPRLIFAPDGSWTLRATCTEAQGKYTLQGNRITLDQVQHTDTQTPCAEENDRIAAEFLRSVLHEGELRLSIRAGTLTLEGGKRSLVLNEVKQS